MSVRHCTYAVENKNEWRRWVTPTPLKDKPVHRWYFFPHSFTAELVHALIDDWKLDETDRILDPFCGAGTTLVAAKAKRVPATGYDLSPLAVAASRVKIANYSVGRLRKAWSLLQSEIDPARWNGVSRVYPILVRDALPGRLLGAFDAILSSIRTLPYSEAERDFFLVALLAVLPEYSRAVATGGWLSWLENGKRVTGLPTSLKNKVEQMLGDVESSELPRLASWSAEQGDARGLPAKANTFSAVITSPPYPNRHDYTRVFGVELMLAFLNWAETRELRYQSFHSHPEAQPNRPVANGYVQPQSLTRAVKQIRKSGENRRIPKMIEGYFLDLFLTLGEIKRVCRPNAKIAVVVGNAQYQGQAIQVDKLTAEVGEQAGLKCQQLIAVRHRGNSAQQMGKFGRSPSRESVVVFLRG